MSAVKKRKIAVENPEQPPLSAQHDYESAVPLGRRANAVKLLAANVAGINARSGKPEYVQYVKNECADVLLLQETKANAGNEASFRAAFGADYKYVYFNHAEKKGQHGVAVYSKIKPLNVTMGLGEARKKHNNEGRVITLEFDHTFVLNVYTPNSGMKLDRLPYRAEYDAAFSAYVAELQAKKPVLIMGDLNVTATSRDLANNKSRYNKVPGCTQQERDDFAKLLAERDLVDLWRDQNPDAMHFTFWGLRFPKNRTSNLGYRLDYVLASRKLVSDADAGLGKVFIRSSRHGQKIYADHVPIGVELKRL